MNILAQIKLQSFERPKGQNIAFYHARKNVRLALCKGPRSYTSHNPWRFDEATLRVLCNYSLHRPVKFVILGKQKWVKTEEIFGTQINSFPPFLALKPTRASFLMTGQLCYREIVRWRCHAEAAKKSTGICPKLAVLELTPHDM